MRHMLFCEASYKHIGLNSEQRHTSGCWIRDIQFVGSYRYTLRPLHWLPIEWRIQHKIATLAFKARSAEAPNYLCNLISFYAPSRSLRSSVTNLLTVPTHKLTFSSRSFRVAVPTIWHSLLGGHPIQSLTNYISQTPKDSLF